MSIVFDGTVLPQLCLVHITLDTYIATRRRFKARTCDGTYCHAELLLGVPSTADDFSNYVYGAEGLGNLQLLMCFLFFFSFSC